MNSKAVGYVRVSTQEQARSGISIPDQEQRIRDYCTARKLELVEIYRDSGVSAGVKLSNRPTGHNLLACLQNGVCNVVAVKLDRLFRNTVECLETVVEWDNQDKALHLIDFGGAALDTKSAMNKTFLTMTAAFAELERELTRERILSAHRYIALEGKWKGGRLPLGYRYHDRESKDYTPEIDPDTAPLVRFMFESKANGWSNAAILRGLAEKGYKTYVAQINNILANRYYISEREVDGKVYPVDIPPLIDRELWHRVQAAKTFNGYTPGRRRYILSGILRCGRCGELMIRWNRASKGYAEYACKGRKHWGTCKGVGIRERIAEKAVLEPFFAHVDEQNYSRAIAQANAREREDTSRVSCIRSEIAALKDKQARLLHLHLEGKLSEGQWDQESKPLNQQLQIRQAELNRAEAELALPAVWEGDIRDDWKTLNLDERRHALRLFINHAVVHPGRGPERVEISWRE